MTRASLQLLQKASSLDGVAALCNDCPGKNAVDKVISRLAEATLNGESPIEIAEIALKVESPFACRIVDVAAQKAHGLDLSRIETVLQKRELLKALKQQPKTQKEIDELMPFLNCAQTEAEMKAVFDGKKPVPVREGLWTTLSGYFWKNNSEEKTEIEMQPIPTAKIKAVDLEEAKELLGNRGGAVFAKIEDPMERAELLLRVLQAEDLSNIQNRFDTKEELKRLLALPNELRSVPLKLSTPTNGVLVVADEGTVDLTPLRKLQSFSEIDLRSCENCDWETLLLDNRQKLHLLLSESAFLLGAQSLLDLKQDLSGKTLFVYGSQKEKTGMFVEALRQLGGKVLLFESNAP